MAGERTMRGQRRQSEPLPLTMTIPQFQRLSGFGRSLIYDMMRTGELRYAQVRGKRMILVQSYVEMLGESSVSVRLRSQEAAE